MRRVLTVFAGVVLSALSASPAFAFCRTTTCDDCPLDENGCPTGGQTIYWPQSCVSFSVQKDGSRIANYATVEPLVASAFSAWQGALCPPSGDKPSISFSDQLGPVLCSVHEYNVGRGNANAIIFHDDSWPYGGDVNTILALTTVTFDKNSGEIHDADLEINGTQPLSIETPVPGDKFDLRSILAHESGHFLGLAHSRDPNSVMRPEYMPGDDSFRHLGDDDIAGICGIYRPGFPTGDCNYTPRYGFSPDCAIRVSTGQGCAVSALGRESSSRGRGAAAILAALMGLAAKRRPRPRPKG